MGEKHLYPEMNEHNQNNAFSNIYRRHQTREANPEIYYPKTPVKDAIKLVLVFITALLFPVIGLIYYGIWRDDNVRLARTGLFGFWVNFLYSAIIILMPFFQF